jgi:hypothetical protein
MKSTKSNKKTMVKQPPINPKAQHLTNTRVIEQKIIDHSNNQLLHMLLFNYD